MVQGIPEQQPADVAEDVDRDGIEQRVIPEAANLHSNEAVVQPLGSRIGHRVAMLVTRDRYWHGVDPQPRAASVSLLRDKHSLC
jgi:hypothetical protein